MRWTFSALPTFSAEHWGCDATIPAASCARGPVVFSRVVTRSILALLCAVAALEAAAAVPPAASAPTADAAPQPSPAVIDAARLLDRGEYLRALDLLEPEALGPGTKPEDIAYQVWMQMRPLIGSYAPPPAFGAANVRLPRDELRKLLRARPRDALDAIAASAAHARLVILNEAHHSPRDRLFGLQVAQRLRRLGYTLLAAEAFNNDPRRMERLARERFPRRGTGSYLGEEPIFADFVRQALQLGYRPVAYEQTFEQGKKGPPGIPGREQAEAENLAAILAAHPGEKMLVYVGFSHATEAPIGPPEAKVEWMAARLKTMTGVDPVTIDQATIAEDSIDAEGRTAWKLVSRKLRRSSILETDGKALMIGPYAGAVDFQVAHPAVRLRDGRPTWLTEMGRRPRPVPSELLPTKGRRLIQAFIASEPADAVPIDQVLVESGRPAPPLMLPPKPMHFAVQDPRSGP
ncbi:MAG: hypothetical protein JWO81_974 [Alphaproteobacteria bacterium]|nr:hypothetical protein [Alphaproteobacteria bacterium]